MTWCPLNTDNACTSECPWRIGEDCATVAIARALQQANPAQAAPKQLMQRYADDGIRELRGIIKRWRQTDAPAHECWADGRCEHLIVEGSGGPDSSVECCCVVECHTGSQYHAVADAATVSSEDADDAISGLDDLVGREVDKPCSE